MAREPDRLRERERDFQDAIIEMASRFHWRCHHTRPAWSSKGWRTPIQGHVGFLDLVLARPGECIIAECKIPPNTLTDEQRAWFTVLVSAGLEVYVWTPVQWPAIEARLRRPPEKSITRP